MNSELNTKERNDVAVKKVRVLMVAPSFDILGGQSVQAARLFERLKEESSIEIDFLPINPRLPGVLRQLQRMKYVRTVVTSVAYVVSLLFHAFRYDVLHVFSASYLSFALAPTPAILIGKLYGRKVLLNYHSGEAEDHLQRWRGTAIPTIRVVDSIIVPSEYLVRVFASFDLEAHPIYNLIDTRRFQFRDRIPTRPVFLSNRNFEAHYGVDKILRAFAIIQQEIPEATLTVAGDGSQREALHALAAELELKNTTFLGAVDPHLMPAIYDAADVYLNASEIDNQPLSLLEAYACGIPIVTTDAGGIPYIVTNRVNGIMVRCGDVDELARQAVALLRNPDCTKQMIDRGLKECEKYSWSAVKNSWLSVYHQLANSKSAQIEPLKNSQPKVVSE